MTIPERMALPEPSALAEQLPLPDQLTSLRPRMLAYATQQLSDASLAEDVVQDSLLAALDRAGAFRGDSALKTWVFAILKNKINDALRGRYRSSQREVPLQEDPDGDHLIDLLFQADGHFVDGAGPADLGTPEQYLHNQQFWRAFQRCLDALPGQQAQLFLMREHLGLSGKEICEQTKLSTSNLNVSLYRARLKLQKCLQMSWLDAPAGGR